MSTQSSKGASQKQKDPLDNKADVKLFLILKKKFSRKFWKDLGRHLGLKEVILDRIEIENQNELSEQAQKMFAEWQLRNAKKATYRCLREALTKLERPDLATKVNEFVAEKYGSTPQTNSSEADSSIVDNCDQMAQRLRRRYEKFTIKGPPGYTEDVLLREHYINMHYCLSDTGEIIALDQIFEQREDKYRPTRFLIHGQCGSGKTTTAAKLLHDWSQLKPYISELFNLVILISGRDCADSLEETLINALDMDFLKKENMDLLAVLQNSSTRLLLALDDYERITTKKYKQLMTIIRKECLPEATIIIFSRTQNLSTGKLESSSVSDYRWVGIENEGFLDRKIEIQPITGEIQEIKKNDFVKRQLPALNERMPVMKRILTSWNRERQSYVISPLHLSLLIGTMKSVATSNVCLTEVHKRFYKLLVQWEFQKEQASTMQTKDTTQLEKRMLEIGQCAFSILTRNKFYPSTAESLTQSDCMDILQQACSLNDKELPGIKQFHREILLEFAAAYYICKTLFNQTSQKNSDAAESVLVRPHWGIPNSYCLTFMMNLAEEKRVCLLKALSNYSAEYSYSFGGLALSLMDTEITGELKESLLPLISVEWRIPWVCSNEYVQTRRCIDFHTSELHEELIAFAIENEKIEILRWDMHFKARIPKVMIVKVFVLELKSSDFIQNIEAIKDIKCKKVHCILHTLSSKAVEDVKSSWLKFIDIILSLDFQHISFEVKDDAKFWLPLLCDAATKGKFIGVDIRWVVCNLITEPQAVTTVTKLVKTFDLEGLYLTICPPVANRPLEPHENNFQENINALIDTAAKARRLNRFVVISVGQPFSINWGVLCQKYHWKWIQLTNVRFQNTNDQQYLPIQIKHLDLAPTEVNKTNITNVLEALINTQPKVQSLNLSLTVLKSTYGIKSVSRSVKELDIKLGDTGLDAVLNQFTNLQVLALSMASTSTDTHSRAFEQWLRNDENSFSLEGIEIWGIEVNTRLTTSIVDIIIRAIRKEERSECATKRRRTDLSSRRLGIEYLMLNAGHFENSATNHELLVTFIQIAEKLQHSIRKKLLPQLDIVCEDLLIQSMCSTNPCGYTSWVDVFPPSKGFTVKHDYWGMSSKDSFRSKAAYDSCPGDCHRFRVTSTSSLT